jgi:RNA polymerase sigma factor (sigma-70 family)
MARTRTAPLIRFVRRVVGTEAADLPDEQLLDRFARGGDESAFALLVKRHGPLVLGAAHRLLRDAHAAEDCFQAVFLVLAHKAGSLRRPGPLGPWLHGVAVRTALKARVGEARRRRRERLAAVPEAVEPPDETARRDLRAALDEALSRLPEKYRLPLVLHYLEGRTVPEVARQLGCPEGTAAARLARARRRCRARLAGRELALAAPVTVPAGLLARTLTAANAAAGVVPPGVAALAEGVLKAMRITRLKVVASASVALALLGIGAGALTYQALAAGGEAPRVEASRRVPVPPGERPKGGPDQQLGRAFPANRWEVCEAAIKLEIRSQRLVLAADSMSIEEDGRVRFAPCWLVRYDAEAPGSAAPQALTLRCREVRLTFDGAVRNLADMGRRRVVAIEPAGNVRLALPLLPPQKHDTASERRKQPLSAELYAPKCDPDRLGAVVLTWKAGVSPGAVTGVALEWASRPAGPWAAIGKRWLPNTGRYSWRLPAALPRKVYLRLSARDTAGNIALAQTAEAVLIPRSGLKTGEFQVPVTANEQTYQVGFVDSGTVTRVSAGHGVRVRVPLLGPAPIDLDFGFPVGKAKEESEQLFNFWLGFFR